MFALQIPSCALNAIESDIMETWTGNVLCAELKGNFATVTYCLRLCTA